MSREKTYLPTLDGWRGIAVIGVILYHGREEFSGSNSLLDEAGSPLLSRRGRILCHQRVSYLWPAVAGV